MDEIPFEPARPYHPWDEEERLTATKGRIRQVRTRKAILAASAAALLGAGAIGVAVTTSSSGHGSRPVDILGAPDTTPSTLPSALPSTTTSTSSTSTTTSTTTPPTTATTVAHAPATTVAPTTTTAPTTITGTVYDPAGQPLAGAHVESIVIHPGAGANVARPDVVTDANGHYSFPCDNKPLLASPWPVFAGPFGEDPFPPSTSPPGAAGYIMSGGATDDTQATVPACGSVVDFHLPLASNVTVHFTNPMPSQGPPDNLYFPGLIETSNFGTQSLDANNDQVLDQLGSGQLEVDGGPSWVTCNGTGANGSYISVAPGQSVTITCTFGTYPGSGTSTTTP